MRTLSDSFSGLAGSKALSVLTLIILCLALYSHCLYFGITNADDEVLITGSLPFLRDAGNIPRAFLTDAFYLERFIDLYRPLQSVSFILDAQLGQDVVFTAHLTNLLLHCAFCISLYFLLPRLGFRRETALAGAMVYAVHYLFLTAVAWIPARGDLLLALFTVLSLLTFIRLLEKFSWLTLLLHLLSFALAIFSKESSAVLPVLFLAYLLTYRKTGLLRRVHLILPVYYLAVQTLYFFFKNAAVAKRAGEVGPEAFIKNIRVLPETLARFFLPLNMATMPEYKTTTTLAGLLIIALLITVCVRLRSRLDRRALFCPAWFALFILPGMAYYPGFLAYFYEHVDHRAYLISVGPLMLCLWLAEACRFPAPRRAFIFVPAVLLAAYLTGFNLYLSRHYRNPSEFALSTIRSNPNSALAFQNYGVELYNLGQEDAALDNFSRAIGIYDRYKPALHYRAMIYLRKGLYREAYADLTLLLSVDPAYSALDYHLRGLINLTLNGSAAAERDFNTALRIDAGFAPSRQELRRLAVPKPEGR